MRTDDIAPHKLFDPAFYRMHAAARGVVLDKHPLVHHTQTNGRSGIMPHPLFSPEHYLAANPDIERSKFDPLTHFLRHGESEKRDPHPLFNFKTYAAAAAKTGASDKDLFQHYLDRGGATLVNPNTLFDAAFYAAGHPSCLAPGETPLGHYIKSWATRGVFEPPWGTALFERRPAAFAAGGFDLILVSHELTRTGAPLILLALLREFVQRMGLNCLVFTQQGGILLEAFREWAPVIDLSVVREAKIAPDKFLLSCLTALHGNARPRAALVNTACVDSIGTVLDAGGLPVITLVHELASGFESKVFEAIYAASKAVIYPAAYVRNEAHAICQLPIDKAAVLPQGLLDPAFGTINPQAARREVLDAIDAPADAFVVLGCGSLDMRKGIDLFSSAATAAIMAQDKAIAAAPDQAHRPIYFVWVGGGTTSIRSTAWYVHEDVTRAGLEGRILFIGARMRTEPFFAGCDAFVLTSRQDPFPCVVHEAMACSLPVIAFENAGGAPEALADGAGLTVPYGDVTAMASALVRLASDPVWAAAFGTKAKERVGEYYNFRAYADVPF